MAQTQHVDSLIIGGGQAGLAASYCLTQRGHPHLVLEQADRPAHVWRTERWDSFTLVTPNWSVRLPGAEYRGDAPDAFMPRDELVAYFERYADQFHLPLRYGVRVSAVEPAEDGRGFRVLAEVAAETQTFTAANVVVATGLFQRPKIPAWAAALPAGIVQLHAGAYRSPDALPEGAVLVVGTAQSGCQIAEELYQSGRKVYLCLGGAGRVPRRYRGKDVFEWLLLTGYLSRTPDQLPSPRAKFAGNPHLSGKHGGHSLNLHQFARDGVTLLGHLRGARGGRIVLAPDMKESLAKADKFEADGCQLIDGYVERMGLDAPREELTQLRDGCAQEEMADLDLAAAGIRSVIWAMGYSFDFSLVKLPVLDGDGFPIQTRGATRYPGLYFVGLPWLHTQQSGLLSGVGQDAEWIASVITGDHPGAAPA